MKPTVKLMTFQSKEVLKELLKNGIYYANNSKSREKQSYSKDIEALGGYHPIWSFQIPEPLDLKKLYIGNHYLNIWDNEMSLGADKQLKDFVMLELEVDTKLPATGKTHNDYKYAVVLPYLKIEWLVVQYKISERFVMDEIGNLNEFSIISHIERYDQKVNPLFEDNFHCLTRGEYNEISEDITPQLPLKAYQRLSKLQ